MVRAFVRGSVTAVVLMALASCELEEVAIPGGDPVIVVHAVLRPDLAEQFVVVERSFDGVTDPIDELGAIPPNFPRIPVTNAAVELDNLDFAGDPCGHPVILTRNPPNPRRTPAPGVYWAPLSCPTMRPGDRLALRVESDNGDIVTGVTQVPGMSGARLVVRGDTVPIRGDSALSFNRDRDSVRVDIQAIAGRLLQVEIRRNLELGPGGASAVGTTILADTTSIAVPGNAIDVFFTASGDDVFRAGRSYVITAALADTNYFDFTRSRNNEITGRGFVNSLRGGIGVLGSLVAATTAVWVTGDTEDPREGVYRLRGAVDTVDIDVTVTAFLGRPLPTADLSAFMDGTFVRWGGLQLPGGGETRRSWFLSGHSIDGVFSGDTLYAEIPEGGESTVVYTLRGVRVVGEPFAIRLAERQAAGERVLDTLTAEQIQ